MGNTLGKMGAWYRGILGYALDISIGKYLGSLSRVGVKEVKRNK